VLYAKLSQRDNGSASRARTKCVRQSGGAHHGGVARRAAYDASLTREQRCSAENGIWLCQNHTKLVDNDTTRYTVDELGAWKRDAEKEALAELEGRQNDRVSALRIDFAFKKMNHAPAMCPTRHDYLLSVEVRNAGAERASGYHVDLELFPASLRTIHEPVDPALDKPPTDS
jgi:hypothetical protein